MAEYGNWWFDFKSEDKCVVGLLMKKDGEVGCSGGLKCGAVKRGVWNKGVVFFYGEECLVTEERVATCKASSVFG